MHIDSCQIVELPQIVDIRGSLTFIESTGHVPFEIRRLFFLYGVPRGQSRGAHAHKTLHQFLICVCGSFDLSIDDGRQVRKMTLDRPSLGVHVPPMIWATEENFSDGAVCMVVASDFYYESDYIRSYDEFLQKVREK